MSIVCLPTQANSLSAHNEQLIKLLFSPSQKNKVLFINKCTGELSTDIEKINKQQWIIFASLDIQINPQQISYRENLSDSALIVLGKTLQLLGRMEGFQEFEQKRISKDKSIMDVFFNSAIKPLFYLANPKELEPFPPWKIHQQKVIDHITQHVMRSNNLPLGYLENTKKFVLNISEFIEINRHLFMATVKATNRNLYIKAYKAQHDDEHKGSAYRYPHSSLHKFPLINYHLCGRAIQYNTDDTIFIHFTKKSRLNDQPIGRDPKIGKGSFKRVSTAIQYDRIEPQQWASASSLYSFKDEMQAAESLAHINGILKIHHQVSYYRKTPNAPFRIQKVYRILTHLCNRGDLDKVIKEKTLTECHKNAISMQLLQTMAEVEKTGWMIRDFKATNIFIHQEKDEEPQVFIGDLGCSCHQDDLQQKQTCGTSIQYIPPELAQVLYQHNFFNFNKSLPSEECCAQVAKATTHKMVSWALGCILWELHEAPLPLPWISQYKIDLKHGLTLQECKLMFEHIIGKESEPFTFNKNSLKNLLIKHLLTNTISERISISDAYLWISGLQYAKPKVEHGAVIVENDEKEMVGEEKKINVQEAKRSEACGSECKEMR